MKKIIKIKNVKAVFFLVKSVNKILSWKNTNKPLGIIKKYPGLYFPLTTKSRLCIYSIVGLPQINHQKPTYGIFSSFLEVYDYSIIKLYPISIFSGKLITLLYYLPKEITSLCFGNTLHGCIAGLPPINLKNPNMAYSLHFWIYMTTTSSNYTK